MPPQIYLQPGSTNTQAVKQLQDYLVSQKVMTQGQVNTGYGTYGPQTKAAVAALQQKLGVNAGADAGYFGPQTIAAIGKVAPGGGAPQTQAHVDAAITSLNQGASSVTGIPAEQIHQATVTGNYGNLPNTKEQPFSSSDEADALAQGTAAVAPYYQAEQTKDTQDTEAALKLKQDSYQKYLHDQALQFQADKTNEDQTAANNGVLFSGGRAQKLQQLGSTYQANTDDKRNAAASDIGSTARSFGYKYGDTAANGLSSYYQLGNNSYNPNAVRGGATSTGLSGIYNANQGFQGTEVNAAKVAAQQRAAGLLTNKANKLVTSGYTNQF